MNQQLQNAIVCPKCHGKLNFDQEKNVLICEADQLVYPIIEQIPVLLVEKAEPLQSLISEK